MAAPRPRCAWTSGRNRRHQSNRELSAQPGEFVMFDPWSAPFNVPGLNDLGCSDDSSVNGFHRSLVVRCRDDLDPCPHAKALPRKHHRVRRPPREAFDERQRRGDLFETAPIGYMEIDRNGMVRRVNRLECKLRGLEQSAMLGVHCAELIPEIDRARYREQIQRKIEGRMRPGGLSARISRMRAGARFPWKFTRNCSDNATARSPACGWRPSTSPSARTAKMRPIKTPPSCGRCFRLSRICSCGWTRAKRCWMPRAASARTHSWARTSFWARNLQDLLPAGALAQVRAAQEKSSQEQRHGDGGVRDRGPVGPAVL